MKHPTGVKLLDRLLVGGLPARSKTLVYGPSFLGKEMFAWQALLAGLAAGTPGILILTQTTAAEAREELAAMDERFPAYEEDGLVRFIDTYSRGIEAEENIRSVTYTDPADLNAIAVAVNSVQGELVAKHEEHLLVFNSVSTLILHSNPLTTFRFLQILTGKARRAGAASILLLDEGMHDEAAVQMFRHLSDGVCVLERNGETMRLRLEGLGIAENPGWLEYRFTADVFEVTGSLAGGRIR